MAKWQDGRRTKLYPLAFLPPCLFIDTLGKKILKVLCVGGEFLAEYASRLFNDSLRENELEITAQSVLKYLIGPARPYDS